MCQNIIPSARTETTSFRCSFSSHRLRLFEGKVVLRTYGVGNRALSRRYKDYTGNEMAKVSAVHVVKLEPLQVEFPSH